MEHADNLQLDKDLAASKASLKTQKEEVDAMVIELEAVGTDLSLSKHSLASWYIQYTDEVGYETVQLQTRQLSSLPDEIEALETTIARLRQQQVGGKMDNVSQNLPLPATLTLLDNRHAESEALDAQIRALQTAIPKKTRELERLHSELWPLKMQKQQAIELARNAIRRKEQGEKGNGDDLELKGRWYSGVEMLMDNVFSVKT